MESSEHVHVGNAIQLRMADGSLVPASSTKLDVHSALLTYGEIVALAGDFFGASNEQPISTSPNPYSAFNGAVGTLFGAHPDEVAAILEVIHEEQAAVKAKQSAGEQASAAFAELGNSLSYKWNEITGGGAASEG